MMLKRLMMLSKMTKMLIKLIKIPPKRFLRTQTMLLTEQTLLLR